MSIFDSFPLMNAYSVNLDWIIKKIRELEEYVRNYTAVNNVAYAGVWDITKQYPQWAIVSDGDKTYMSNKPVPAGIAITNTEYWLQLADLDPRIAGIISDLSAINSDLSAINSDLSAINAVVWPLDSKMSAVARNIAGKRFLVIGDSISDETITGNDRIKDVWVKRFREMVGIFGGTVTNMSLSSRGYVVSAGGESFKSLIEKTSFTNYDTIIVFGGVNDFLNGIQLSTLYQPTAGSFWEALNSCFDTLRNSGKEVYIVSPLPTDLAGNSLYNVTLDMYRTALYSSAFKHGFHFINGSTIAPFGSGGYYADGLHPLNKYTHFIAEYIFDKILSNGELFQNCLELAEKKGLSGTNCTYNITSYCQGPEVIFDIRGTATGEYTITIPNVSLYLGMERRATVTGVGVTKLITSNGRLEIYGDNPNGEFAITVRGYSNSLAIPTIYTH